MSRAKVLFLDIDGVLNGHDWDADARSCTIRRDCVDRLNRVMEATDCRVVLSSAWRYMILGGAMTLSGFGYMLRTHGARVADRLIGHTRADVAPNVTDRGAQIREWLDAHPDVASHLAIDDEDFGITAAGVQLLPTDGKVGMTDEDADRAVRMLGGGGR